MSAPDLKIQLSAEGVQQVIAALRSVDKEAKRTRDSTNKATSGSKLLNEALGDMKGLLPQLGIAAAVTGLSMMGKHALDTADNMGKMAQKTGMSAESLSVYSFAARTADVEQETLNKSLIKFTRTMDDVDHGNKKASGAVQDLFGSANALNGKNMDDRLRMVVDRLGKLEPGARKTALAIEFFGKQGAELIPLLDDMGGNFDEVKKKAAAMGLVISTDVAAAAQKANDAMTDLKSGVEGVVVQLVSGMAPALQGISEGLLDATQSQGVNAFQKIGELIGDVARGIVSVFLIVGKVVGSILAGLSMGFEDWLDRFRSGLAAIRSGQILSGSWQIAKAQSPIILIKDLLMGLGKDGVWDGLGDDIMASLDKVWNPDTKPATKRRGGGGGGGGREADSADKKRKADIESAYRDMEKAWREGEDALAKARADAADQANERAYKLDEIGMSEYFDKRVQLIQAEYERERDAIEAEIAALQELQSKSTDELEILAAEAKIRGLNVQKDILDIKLPGQVTSVRDEQAGITFAAKQGGYEGSLNALALEKQRIQNDVVAGKLNEAQATDQILEMERQRIPLLRAQLDMLSAMPSVTLEQARAIEQARVNLDGMEAANIRASDSALQLRDSLSAAAFNQLSTFFTTTIFQAKSAADAFKQFGLSAVMAIQQILTQMILLQAFKAAGFATAAPVMAATGGYIAGPGTGTSDSIDARLSNGEFVLKSDSVAAIGIGRLNYMNRHGRLPGFADGGVVGSVAGVALESNRFEGTMNLGLEDGLVERRLERYFDSSAGTTLVVKAAARRPKAFNQNLGRSQ